jgi:hypothetical protein
MGQRFTHSPKLGASPTSQGLCSDSTEIEWKRKTPTDTLPTVCIAYRELHNECRLFSAQTLNQAMTLNTLMLQVVSSCTVKCPDASSAATIEHIACQNKQRTAKHESASFQAGPTLKNTT